MKENGFNDRPTITMMIKGRPVPVFFSDTEAVGLKENIRDVLTESFEERFLKSVDKSDKDTE